jgi:tetratricopeptide (TPR) repeat protein
LKKTIAATVFVVLALQMPAFAGADFDHAVQLYNQKQYRPALDLFLRAASTEPKNAGTYFYAANCFYQLGNMTRAIQTYNMVVQYYPNSPQAVMAKDFLDRVASAQAAKEQKQSEKKQVADVSPSAPEKVAKEESKEPIDCRDLLVIVRPQKDRPPVSDELTAAMKSKLSSMPHDVARAKNQSAHFDEHDRRSPGSG